MANIKNLRPKDFTLDKLDEELLCMAMIRALPEGYGNLTSNLQRTLPLTFITSPLQHTLPLLLALPRSHFLCVLYLSDCLLSPKLQTWPRLRQGHLVSPDLNLHLPPSLESSLLLPYQLTSHGLACWHPLARLQLPSSPPHLPSFCPLLQLQPLNPLPFPKHSPTALWTTPG